MWTAKTKHATTIVIQASLDAWDLAFDMCKRPWTVELSRNSLTASRVIVLIFYTAVVLPVLVTVMHIKKQPTGNFQCHFKGHKVARPNYRFSLDLMHKLIKFFNIISMSVLRRSDTNEPHNCICIGVLSSKISVYRIFFAFNLYCHQQENMQR